MTNSSNSQRGGESIFRGLDYQKKFIAYLCTEMLLGKRKIERISCEHLDDIEVEEDSKLVYYQIKSTTQDSLPSSEIINSIELFSSTNNSAFGNSPYHEYVLVSNARIQKFADSMRRHPFNQLDDEFKNKIKLLEKIRTRSEFLQYVYLLRGPSLQDISSTIVTSLVIALIDRKERYNYLKMKDDLLSYINDMCPGPTDLEDMKIINDEEKEDYNLKHKTITTQITREIIEKNRIPATAQEIEPVSKSISISYDIRAAHPDNEQLDEIHEAIDEYNGFPEGHELRYTYLQKLNEKSRRFNLYNDKEFLDFLKQILHNTMDKHIILESLFILHNLIITSKIESEKSFIEYVNREYIPMLIQHLETREERFEYALFKIEQIIDEIKELISPEQICEMYWKRIFNVIHTVMKTGITDNTLWNCINNLNKCKIKKDWRKWLIAKDEYSDIKNTVIKELTHFF